MRAQARPVEPDTFAVRGVAVLFFVSALLSILRVTVLTRWMPVETAPGVTYATASFQALLGVALWQGSTTARRFVVGCVWFGFLLMLGLATLAFLGEGAGFALLATVILVLVTLPPVLALQRLLAGDPPSRTVTYLAFGVLGLYSLGSFAIEVLVFRAIDGRVRSRIAEWSQPEREFRNDAAGLRIVLPGDWALLRPGSPFAPEGSEPLALLAHAGSTATAMLQIEENRTAPISADGYLDRELQGNKELVELTRETAQMGSVRGRKSVEQVRGEGRAFRLVRFAWQDSWRLFDLVVSYPLSREQAAGAALEELQHGIQFRALVTDGLRDLAAETSALAPHLSQGSIQTLVNHRPGKQLSAEDLFRLGHFYAAKGLTDLTPGETRKLGEITAVLFAGIAPRDRARLGPYLERIRFDKPSTPAEDREMALIMKTGTDRLTPAQLGDLRGLLERSISSATLLER
jgi:hypothetical protein